MSVAAAPRRPPVPRGSEAVSTSPLRASLSSRFRCGKAVVAAAAFSSSRLGSASSLITPMVCSFS